MAEIARGFVRVVERRRIMRNTVFAQSAEKFSDDGPSTNLQTGRLSSSVTLELAYLVVDEDV